MLIIDLPRANEWGYSQDRAMREMEQWGLAMGAPTVPRISDNLLERIVGYDRMKKLQSTKFQDQNSGGNWLPAVFSPGDEEENFGRDPFRSKRGGRGGGRRGGFESGERFFRDQGQSVGGNRSKPLWERRGRD
jgi:hypothetical protein